jgi:hypothetical protein
MRTKINCRAQDPIENLDDLLISVQTDDVLHGFYHSVLPFFSSRTQPSEQLIELKFNELLLNILNNTENGELVSYMHEVASQKTGVLEHVMEANFPYRLELSEFATLCNRSLSSFKRDFENSWRVFHSLFNVIAGLIRAAFSV